MGRDTEKDGKDWRLGALAIVFAIALWQVVAAVIIKYPFILPAPTDVLSAFISLLQKGEVLPSAWAWRFSLVSRLGLPWDGTAG